MEYGIGRYSGFLCVGGSLLHNLYAQTQATLSRMHCSEPDMSAWGTSGLRDCFLALAVLPNFLPEKGVNVEPGRHVMSAR